MKMRNSFCAVLIFSCLSVNGQQDQNKIKEFISKYDAFIQQVAEKIPEIPAIAVVVIKDDKPVFLKAYGWADKEAGIKADEYTLFYISSTTKPFLALTAALLDKEGSIKLNEPLTKYANGISFKNPIPKKVTIQNLLTHTSGLRNEALQFRLAYSGEIEPGDVLRVFGAATSYIDTNHNKYSYTNLGYNIYGILLQQALGKKWQDLLQERIFKPMKMEHTVTYASEARSKKMQIAYPYVYTGENGLIKSWLPKSDNNMHSAGGMLISISDLGAWLNMNMNNGKLDGKQVFPAGIIKKCQTGYTKTKRELPPFTGDGEYGLGWQIGTYKNEKVIYHHGGYPGYHNHASFFPDRKIAVAVLVNESTVGSIAERFIATYAYEWWFGIENIEEDHAKKLNELVKAWETGKKSEQDGAAARAKRSSQLSLPLENYTGKYVNADFGTVEISIQNDSLAVKQGIMRFVSSPFTEKETVRVELIPGSGQVLKFIKNAEGKIEAVMVGGREFKKIN
jgi:CubicO group peptidase (beta-lactamase class C family)